MTSFGVDQAFVKCLEDVHADVPQVKPVDVPGNSQHQVPAGCQRRGEKSHFRQDKVSHFRRVKVSHLGHTGDSHPGGYPVAALPSSSFTGVFSTPALRLLFSL